MRTKKSAVGLPCLPTSTVFVPHDPAQSAAFLVGQWAYLLEAVDPDEPHAQVAQVIVTSPEQVEEWAPGELVRTKHLGGKQLPTRRVTAVFRDGKVFGEDPGQGARFPHWELMTGITEDEVRDRIAANRKAIEARKAALRAKKQGATKNA